MCKKVFRPPDISNRTEKAVVRAKIMQPATLVIFDYSGTLSLEAADFGRPGNLERYLKESGLTGAGIVSADLYWQKVVNPTWPRASTTKAGFKSIATGCIEKMALSSATSLMIASAVSKFVDEYMRHSRIDERWYPLLSDIQNLPGVIGIIATDHYAEATGAVRAHLTALDINSVPATGKETFHGDTVFIVANSADIGHLKASRRFWRKLTRARLSIPVEDVILVDDFGSNEPDRFGYSKPEKIKKRIEATRKAVGEVFRVEPQIIHFEAGENPDRAIIETIKVLWKKLKQ